MTALIYGYAVLLAVGGLIGFIKANSVPSLVMGVLSGLLVGYSAHVQSYNKKNGNQLTMILSLVLLGIMGMRFYNSGKFMPAGLVSLVSAIVFAKSFLSL